jgi:hypothetical protein
MEGCSVFMHEEALGSIYCCLCGLTVNLISGKFMVDIFGVPETPYWNWVDPGAMAMIGSVSFFGGVTRYSVLDYLSELLQYTFTHIQTDHVPDGNHGGDDQRHPGTDFNKFETVSDN